MYTGAGVQKSRSCDMNVVYYTNKCHAQRFGVHSDTFLSLEANARVFLLKSIWKWEDIILP